MEKVTIIGFIIEAVALFIPVGALLVKYGKVLAVIEQHDKKIETLELNDKAITPILSQVSENSKDITDLKDTQKSYQSIIEKSLDEIKQSLATMNTALQVLASRIDYVEKEKGTKC